MSILREKPKIIVVLGQTASGKSDLAVKLAKKFNGEIISADSRQVYKGLDIGSGKVPRDKNYKLLNYSKALNLNEQPYFYKGIRHYLINVASPKRTFTVNQYQKLAKNAIKKILRKNKLPIICGGTGFYIDSLIYDYKLPKTKPNLELRKKFETESAEKLFERLKKMDPERAKNIDPHNKRRLIRVLEILEAGNKISPLEKKSSYEVLKIGIKKNPEDLKKLIRKRLKKRIRIGMIKEVENLHKQGLSWKKLDNFGLEYRFISRYLRGLINKKEMVEILEKEIGHYAKRQMTWFKKDRSIIWTEDEKEALALADEFKKTKASLPILFV